MLSVINFERVSKKFRIRHSRPRSFQELFLNALSLRRNLDSEDFWSLRDVTFSIAPGEAVGLVGPNGAGKSTTLKLVSRIIVPTSGQVQVKGTVTGLLELGAGFHPDLTGRENIYLYGAIMGMNRKRIARRLDAIVTFAELEQFIDVPVKHYSSGMYMRLGFATAVHSDLDVLLVDEVLAVGDQAFRTKCFARVRELHERGVTILFVSHDLDLVVRLCDRAIWLDKGELRENGEPGRVVASYLNHLMTRKSPDAKGASSESTQGARLLPGNRWGSGDIVIESVRFFDADGQEQTAFDTGERMVVRMRYRARRRIERPVFGIAVHRDDGVQINESNTRFAGLDIPYVEGEGELVFSQPLPLLGGTFYLSAAVYDHYIKHPFDHREQQFVFNVNSGTALERYGVVRLDTQWEHVPALVTL